MRKGQFKTQLNGREKFVLEQRFLGKTYRKIGEEYEKVFDVSVNPTRVSNLLKRARRKISKSLYKQANPEHFYLIDGFGEGYKRYHVCHRFGRKDCSLPDDKEMTLEEIKPDKNMEEFAKQREQIRDEIIRVFEIPPVFLGGQKRKGNTKKVLAKQNSKCYK